MGLVLLLVGVAHRDALLNQFFGSDTWPWLVSTNLNSLSDVGRVAFSPIMSGTRFASEVALFYHPLTALSYSLDRVLFGLQPFGFYATNLALHLVAVGALFSLARVLGSSWWAAIAAALVLGLHPIAAATVPSLPRRQDMLVAALLILSMVLLARGLSGPRLDVPVLSGALAVFFLALGGKEIAYAALPGIAALSLIAARNLKRSAAITTAFVVVEVIAFAIRWRVLGGLGGYYGSEATRGRLDGLLEFFVRPYVTDVLWPLQPIMPERLRDWLILFILGSAVVTLCIITASRQRRALALLAVTWQLSFLALYVVVHNSLSAYLLYVPLAGFALLVAAVLDAAGDWFAEHRPWLGIGVATPISGVAAVVLLAGVVWTSPLRATYTEFRDASFVSDQFIHQAIPCIASGPPDVPVVIGDLPHAVVYGTTESQFIDAFVFEPYSVESVLRVLAPDVTRSVDVLAIQDVMTPPTMLSVTCTQDRGRWLVQTHIS